MVIYKKIIIFITMLLVAVLINGCYGMVINVYKYKSEDVKYIEEAMDEFFNRYPETHITQEILVDYKNAYSNKHPKDDRIDSLFPNKINTECIRNFFGKMKPNINSYSLDTVGREGYFKIISSKKNIYYIRLGYYTTYGTPLIELLGADFSDIKYMENYIYYNDYPKARIKEAKAEFESEILPKILECIETVKQRHKENE